MKILDVGQCGVDGPEMEELFTSELDADVLSVDTADEAKQALREEDFDVVLVNRVIDADGSSGVDLIGQLKTSGVKTAIMLVSDHEDAQEQAVKLGGVRGFGKSELGSRETLQKIREAAEQK
jgi:DNA-binding response OmpR family regulator